MDTDRMVICDCTQIPELGPCEHNELACKTWMQLRQCVSIARGTLRTLSGNADINVRRLAGQTLEAMEKVLTDGSTDPVR